MHLIILFLFILRYFNSTSKLRFIENKFFNLLFKAKHSPSLSRKLLQTQMPKKHKLDYKMFMAFNISPSNCFLLIFSQITMLNNTF